MITGCKHKALYVKFCAIQNGVEDSQGDVLDATDIKKIFTSFNNQDSFEIYHNEIPISNVSLLENYISSSDEVIAGTTVPSGSWNGVIRVDNPSIKEMLLNNDFGGVSLNNRVQTACSTGLTGQILYQDLADAECVIPVYISFVDEPANGVGLHIMDYDVYIHKSKNSEDKEMSLLEDLKALISKAEEESEEEAPTEDVATEEPVEEEVIEKDAEEVEVSEKEVDDPEVIENEAETEENDDSEVIIKEEDGEVDDAPVIEKEAEDVEVIDELVVDTYDVATEIEALKEELATLKAEIEALKPPANPIDEEVNAEEVDPVEPIVVKSAKIDIVEEPTVKNDFYERTGRDPVTGCRIKSKSRILN